jgi:hypothetical protein
MTTDLISDHVIDQAMFLTDQPISCHDFKTTFSAGRKNIEYMFQEIFQNQ